MQPTLARRTMSRLIVLALGTLALLNLGCAAETATETSPLAPDAAARPRLRTYYIAADLVEWNYAPSGRNLITGAPFGPDEQVFTEAGEGHIGLVYRKALYREYTDETFTTLKPRPPEWEHLGILGPVVRGQVDDTIRVVFRNNADRPYSFHVHGFRYGKDSEGAPYDDGVPPEDKGGAAVKPGSTYTYQFTLPERAGPGPDDGSSIVWMYHSHVDEPRDANSGLIGPIIVTARGRAREDGRPKDVDREFVNLFMIFDENKSWYLDENVARASADPADEAFGESNLKHGINGYIYGNLPMQTMRQGERVRWYMIGFGNEVDLHTPHWHGQTGLAQGMRTEVIELLPGSMKVFDMQPDNPGIWLEHCHVHDHIAAGMLARFTVTPAGGQPLVASRSAWLAQVDEALHGR
ncbi:MAG TPA: multicopper oxidase domain-containing protein [Gemmatimonadales bacterium]|nr:multicopper oxidase domain-containing protein [Gemmatimonadales bacterium]